MSEISMYEAQKKKMQGLCEEHDLTYRFRKDCYPITFTIRPVQGVNAQLSMLEEVEDSGYRSPDASMTWIFADGVLETKVQGGTFTISKTLRSKIEIVLTKMITFWQQYFFRNIMERGALKQGMMPVIDEDEVDGEEYDEEFLETEREEDDELDDEAAGNDLQLVEAARIIRAENKASVSLLQRRLSMTYAEAYTIMERLEKAGVVGAYNGSEPREILPYDEPNDEEG